MKLTQSPMKLKVATISHAHHSISVNLFLVTFVFTLCVGAVTAPLRAANTNWVTLGRAHDLRLVHARVLARLTDCIFCRVPHGLLSDGSRLDGQLAGELHAEAWIRTSDNVTEVSDLPVDRRLASRIRVADVELKVAYVGHLASPLRHEHPIIPSATMRSWLPLILALRRLQGQLAALPENPRSEGVSSLL